MTSKLDLEVEKRYCGDRRSRMTVKQHCLVLLVEVMVADVAESWRQCRLHRLILSMLKSMITMTEMKRMATRSTEKNFSGISLEYERNSATTFHDLAFE